MRYSLPHLLPALQETLFYLKLKFSVKNDRNYGMQPLFYKQRFFSTHPLCCFTFLWIGLLMLLRCCLMDITIIRLRHILHLACRCPCLALGLLMSYLGDLFFICSVIFIALKQTHMGFVQFLEYLLDIFLPTWRK